MDHDGAIRQQDTQVEFDNIHALILARMSTNKAELVEVNWYGSIAANDEYEDKFYIVRFTSIQEEAQNGMRWAAGKSCCSSF